MTDLSPHSLSLAASFTEHPLVRHCALYGGRGVSKVEEDTVFAVFSFPSVSTKVMPQTEAAALAQVPERAQVRSYT